MVHPSFLQSPPNLGQSNLYTILAIDDNPTNLGVIVGYLEAEQFTMLVAQDGESGIKRARYAQPDLILLDVLMPGIDGFETCRQLKNDPKTQDIPVIFMTALSSADDKVKGFEVGAVDYVTKPIDKKELLARIKLHIKLQSLTQALEEKTKRLADANQALEWQVAERTNQLSDTERTLQQKDVQSSSIFDAVSDGLVTMDLDTGRVLTANPAYCQMHGYSLEKLKVLNPFDVIPSDHHEKFWSFLATVKAGQEFLSEAICRRPDGSQFYIEIKSVPFRHEGRPCALSILRDVSDRKMMELALQEQNRSLEQTLRELQQAQVQIVQSEKMSSLGQLVAGIAHEINNPVNFIHGNLSHVQEYAQDLLEMIALYQEYCSDPSPTIQARADDVDLEFLQEDLAKILKSMQVGTERIRQIVLSLRNFSRMDESEFKAVNIHDGIDSTLLILQHRIKGSPERPAIEVIRDYGDLPLVECYPGQVNQVLMNLLANALDALEEQNADRSYQDLLDYPSQIRIGTSRVVYTPDEENASEGTDGADGSNREWVEIAIADNGLGIPEHLRKKIFEPFFTTKPVGKGTGMGMSISYQIIVEKHGGTLTCTSTVGEGTTFIIRIPVQQSVQQSVQS